MADFKIIKRVYPNAASDTSLSSAFTVPPEFSHFALVVPPTTAWCVTATCHIQIQGSADSGTTYYDVAYSQNPATATSSCPLWEVVNSHVASGAIVICEALQFVPMARLRFTNTATASTTPFVVFGRKFD